MDYASKYFLRKSRKSTKGVGITEETLDKLRDIVQLVAVGNTSIRSYISAIVADHLKEYRFVHEYLRRVKYNRMQPDDVQKFQAPAEVYAAAFLGPNPDSKNTGWIRVDADCVDAMKNLVAWTETGATIGSMTEAILIAHFIKYKDLLDEMKSDVFNCQP
ncbi:MAG: DUF3408 domain-containing protein [Muribaculaceae bacterium]|nr:DUF3408 domain-containing protein [Muribaculaceae bacterium]